MNSRIGAITLLVAVAAILMAVTPGFSANDQAQPTTKKMSRQQRVAPPPPPADYPSRPMNSCDYDRAAGRCVIDLGFGRCTECSVGPR